MGTFFRGGAMAGKGNFWGRAADWVIPGNAYNSTTGRWNPATTKVGVASAIAGMFGPPGADALVQQGAQHGLFGGGIQSGLRSEGVYNNIADQYGDTLDWAQNYTRSARPDFGFSPQVSVGSPQYMPQGYNTGSASGLLDGYLSNNVQKATDNTNNRMDAEMQAIQARINGQSVPTMGSVNARPIGGGLGFGGGHYNNGVGAGTGFGAANYTNDAWGDMASSFGVGGMSGGSRDQPLDSYGPTGRKTRA